MKTKLFSILSLAVCFQSANAQTKVTSGTLGMMEARQIGPAVMGGRITAIDAVAKEPRIMYVGTAGGGIWKSTTGGTLFKPIFDKYNQSVGALAIDQSNPDVVWCGTGESNTRNSVSIGTGLYKTTDAGENWVKVGLDSSERISRIAINPKNTNEVYVAVPGPLWSDSKNRGLYKTTDGGKTWNSILPYVNERTGCAEVLVNPKNPDIIYASTWEFRRKPYSFSSGGKGSAVYKSMDGGKTWKKLSNGLPTTEFGRVAMALAPSQPDNLFAIVEAKKTNLYLSTDGGESWKEQGSNNNVEGRPFYFSVIAVDPTDPMRVYRPAWSMSISDDGGKSFKDASQAGGWVHSDMHALWINPNNPSHLMLGTDGGIYMSLDKGNNWLFINNIPISMFYHVQVDDASPYNVYGGLQDNGSWMTASQSIGGIDNGDWINVGGGDGFWVQPDPNDKNIVYSESQGGYAYRINRVTNEYQDIQPKPEKGEKKLRFNWNTPLYIGVTSKKLYEAAQFLFRSSNQGRTWERISPDLTTNDTLKQKQEESGGVTTDNSSAENHCTIFTVAESPFDGNTIFVGTDDGNLQITTDGGKTWTKVNQNVKGIPKQTWVSSIEPSKYDKNTLYATFDNHMYGDMNTYCAKSTDMGKTWKLLNTMETHAGYAHKIKEDIVNPNLLFLGCEFGLYVSFDGGDNWAQMNAKIPNCAVRDIQIHPKTNDLVLATHGRGILIVDDISPLRQLTPEVLNSDLTILTTRPTPVTNGHWGGAFPSAGGFVGPNSPEDCRIIYYLKDRVTSGDLTVEIFDKDGKSLGTVPATKRKGINKINWSMRTKPPRTAKGVRLDYAGFTGMLVEPGTYTVRITKGDKTYSGNVTLVKDPISQHSDEDIAQERKSAQQLYNMSEDLAFFNQQVLNQIDSSKSILATTKNATVKKAVQDYLDKLEKIRKELIATKEGLGITGEERIREKLSELYAQVVTYDGRPTDSQLQRVDGLKFDMQKQKDVAEALWKNDMPKLNAQLRAAKETLLTILSRADFDGAKKAPEERIYPDK